MVAVRHHHFGLAVVVEVEHGGAVTAFEQRRRERIGIELADPFHPPQAVDRPQLLVFGEQDFRTRVAVDVGDGEPRPEVGAVVVLEQRQAKARAAVGIEGVHLLHASARAAGLAAQHHDFRLAVAVEIGDTGVGGIDRLAPAQRTVAVPHRRAGDDFDRAVAVEVGHDHGEEGAPVDVDVLHQLAGVHGPQRDQAPFDRAGRAIDLDHAVAGAALVRRIAGQRRAAGEAR